MYKTLLFWCVFINVVVPTLQSLTLKEGNLEFSPLARYFGDRTLEGEETHNCAILLTKKYKNQGHLTNRYSIVFVYGEKTDFLITLKVPFDNISHLDSFGSDLYGQVKFNLRSLSSIDSLQSSQTPLETISVMVFNLQSNFVDSEINHTNNLFRLFIELDRSPLLSFNGEKMHAIVVTNTCERLKLALFNYEQDLFDLFSNSNFVFERL